MIQRYEHVSKIVVLLVVSSLVLGAAAGTVASANADGTIVGSVTNEDGDGLPGATVELVDAYSGVVVDTTTTTDGGSYGFEGVAPGEYRVEAEFYGETGSAEMTLGDGETALANVIVSGVSPNPQPEATVDASTPDSIAPGETATVTFTVGNDGTAQADSGGLQLELSERVSVESVSGDGTNSPDRFFLNSLQPGDAWTVEYTLRAAPDATGSANVTATAFVGQESNATTNVSVPIKAESENLADHYRSDDGDVGLTDVLDAIDAFNSDDGEVSGYGPVDVGDILDLIEAFNE